MSNSLSLDEAAKKARDVIKAGGAIRFSGRCGVGKTTLCETILENCKRDALKGTAFMVAPRSREAVDNLSDKVLSKLLSYDAGVYALDPRPVKTPAALAFTILKKYNENIRLLDVSDQTKLISKVMEAHVKDVKVGNDCSVCKKLRSYIHLNAPLGHREDPITASKFEKVFLAPGFITKLREVFARFSELGIGLGDNDINEFENNLAGFEIEEERRSRARISWEIVQSLRSEYATAVALDYPDYYDNSYMLIECRKKVETAQIGECLPRSIIVDDCQDLNLATFDLLKALHAKGVPLVFVGNDDESVQGYKGAFPDVLSIMETEGFEGPYSLEESSHGLAAQTGFLQDVAKNIGSWFELEGTRLRERSREAQTNVLSGSLFKCNITNSEEEEISLLKNQIFSCMMSGKVKSWGDLAVIANDNAFLKKIGEALERDAIPFKYTAVNDESIKDSDVIKGMLALMQLAYYASGREPVEHMRQDAFSLAMAALRSPLFENAKTAQIFVAKNIFQAVLSSLKLAKDQETQQAKDILKRFSAFEEWICWEGVAEENKNLEAFFAFLLINPADRENIFEGLEADEKGGSNHYQSLEKLFDLLEAAKSASTTPELFCRLWEGLGLSHKWQSRALKGGGGSLEVNEWLDQLIRLQDLADTGKDGESVPDFLKRVSGSYIESDSLAQVAPKDDRITLSSPSGTQSQRYKKVWVVGVQEKVWDKPSREEGLFSTPLLEAAATKDRVEKAAPKFMPVPIGPLRDYLQAREKYSNWRNFLVASSRSEEETVFLAVSDQEHAPFHALNSLIRADSAYNSENGKSELELDSLTVGGMVAYCRAKLAKAILDGNRKTADDASAALQVLLRSGAEEADPASWNFMRPVETTGTLSGSNAEIHLNPSGVYGIWNTPVEQVIQNNEGPVRSEPQMQFGTDIHLCAQRATEEGKDRSEGQDQLKEELWAYFEKLQNEQADFSALERGACRRKARKAITNLAVYFSTTRDPRASEECPHELRDMPPLEEAFAEQFLEADFTLEEICEMARRSDAFKEMDVTKDEFEDEFIEAMEILGNFDGLASVKGKKICLSGKIDRLERRAGGVTYVIDYKTGSTHCDGIKAVSDLQLFCYQLLLHFNRDPETKKKLGDRAEKSMLFSVEKEPYPSSAKDRTYAKKHEYNYEHYYQPPIFDVSGNKFNEGKNDRKKTGRMPESAIGSANPILRTLHVLGEDDDPETWLPWILYMFSKFLYAVRYVDASRLQMREIDGQNSDQHLIEKAMTIYGMAEKVNDKNDEKAGCGE